MKISLSLLSVGMIAAAAGAGSTDYVEHSGVGLHQTASRGSRSEAVTTLFSTDFNSYTSGVVCTDLTGSTMGQDSWWQLSGNTWNAFAVSAATAGNKKLRSSFGSTSTTGTNFLWQDNGGGGYTPFTTGKGFEADFNLTRFSNTLSTKKGQTQLRAYDATAVNAVTGLIFDNYATGTQASIRGLGYLNFGTGAATYAFTLATGSATTSMGVGHDYYCAYDSCTGFLYWGWDVGLATETNWYFDSVAGGSINALGQVVNEADFLSVRNTATSAGFMDIDNVAFYAYDCPAPGAAALLGLAGFASRRRR